MIATLEDTLLSDLKTHENKNKKTTFKVLYDKTHQQSTIPVNEKNFKSSVKDSKEDVERILNNDHIQVSSIKPLINSQREIEIEKERNALLLIINEHDALKTSNKYLENEYKKFMDYITHLQEIGEADVDVNEKGKHTSKSILQQVDDIEDLTNKERRAFFMYDHMRIRVRDDIVEIKSKISTVMGETAKRRSEFSIFESTLRQLIYDVKLLENQYEALVKEIQSRRAQRQNQLLSLQNMVSDGQKSVANFQKTSLSLEKSSDLLLKTLSEFVPTAPPVRMMSSQRSFHTMRSGYFSGVEVGDDHHTDAGVTAPHQPSNVSLQPQPPPSSSPSHKPPTATARKLRYQEIMQGSSSVVHNTDMNNSVNDKMSPTNKEKLRPSGSSTLSRSTTPTHSKAALHKKSNSKLNMTTQSTDSSHTNTLQDALQISSSGSQFLLPNDFTASMKLEELLEIETELHRKMKLEEKNVSHLKTKEKDLTKKIESSLTNRQWMQAEVERNEALHDLKHALFLLKEKDTSCQTQLEFLRLAIPRFLLKVFRAQLNKHDLRQAQSYLNKLQNIQMEELPETISKLEKQLLKMTENIDKTILAKKLQSQQLDKEVEKDSQISTTESVQTQEPGTLLRGLSQYLNVSKDSDVLHKQQYINLMSIKPTTNPRNIRVQSTSNILKGVKSLNYGKRSKKLDKLINNGDNSSERGMERRNSNVSITASQTQSSHGSKIGDDGDDNDDSDDDNISVASSHHARRRNKRRSSNAHSGGETSDDETATGDIDKDEKKSARIIPVLGLNRNTLKDISMLIVEKNIKSMKKKNLNKEKDDLRKKKFKDSVVAMTMKKSLEEEEND